MPNIRITVLAALATGGLLIAGCGSGGGSDKLAKADLAKKADAICVKYNPKQKALGQPNDAPSFIAYLKKVIPLSAAQGKELKALKPADDVKAEWTGLLKDYDTVAAAATQALTALQKGDTTEFQRIIEDTNTVNDASNKKLDALGAPHCGSKSNA